MDQLTWVLVADASAAKIYGIHKTRLLNQDQPRKEELKLLSEHTHAESRKKESELVSDKQGYYGSGNFCERTDPKKHEEDRFALELAKILNHGHSTNSYRDLILIAPPAFMGMLNQHLTDTVKNTVSLTIEKDYMHEKENELVKQLTRYL
jgi:protein required for attachment to host cells